MCEREREETDGFDMNVLQEYIHMMKNKTRRVVKGLIVRFVA